MGYDIYMGFDRRRTREEAAGLLCGRPTLMLKPSFARGYHNQVNEPQAATSYRIIYNKNHTIISSYLM